MKQNKSIADVISQKSTRGNKKVHNLMFYNDIWDELVKEAKNYNISVSKYLELVHKIYIESKTDI